MRVLSLAWVGTRTTAYPATVAFFRDVLGLAVPSSETGFTVPEVPGGATVEVFGPVSDFNRYPVAGLLVGDLEGPRRSCGRPAPGSRGRSGAATPEMPRSATRSAR